MNTMTDFIPIDLYSQRKAICEYIVDWPIEKVLDWLHHFGRVQKANNENYLFWSFTGIASVFCFDDNGKIIIPNVYGWL